MSNEITVKENTNTVTVAEDYKKIAIHWLESTGNLKKFNEQQKNQFIDICVAYGLNPIKKEVYGIPYGDKFNLIVGYESFIKRAERSNRLDGWGVEIHGDGPNMKAVITIYRKDFTKPFIHEVYLEEYNTHQNLWKTKPRTMLRKVAIAQGFRMCFSEELGGIPYTKEELGDIEATESVELVETAPTIKTVTTPNLSTENPKTLTDKVVQAETVEVITPKSRDELLKIKLYTKEQANELASVMTKNYSNGDPVFTTREKESYKTLLVNGEFEKAIKQAKETLLIRLDDAGELSAELEN